MTSTNTKSTKKLQLEISWDNDTSKKTRSNESTVYRSQSVYRGGTAFTTRRQHQIESIGSSTYGGKQEIGMNATSASSESNLNIKSQPPMIEVYNYNLEVVETAGTAVKNVPVQKPSEKQAPKYDHFQPMLAQFSTTKDTQQMAECMVDALKILVKERVIDFYQESKFVFAGRAFGDYGDCEYRISIFDGFQSDTEECKSVIEIRRSFGEAFTFAGAESRILKILRANAAIPQTEMAKSGNLSASSDDTPFSSFTFGQLPDYSSLEWPTVLPHFKLGYDSELSTDDEQKEKMFENKAVDAELCLHNAITIESTQQEWRFDVAQLKQEIEKNAEGFKAIADIVSKLLKAIDIGNNFDAFVTRTILQCITLLIDAAVEMPKNFQASIENIQARWKLVVENQISDNVCFKFAPSQQVGFECELILNKYSNIQ